jgi:hypothetical protein
VSPDREWTVAKLRPDGSVAARYEAVELSAPDGWIAVRAMWIYGRVDIGYFAFETGDVLNEYFSLDRYYNAFATFRSTGEFVGWYCNVTYPTIVCDRELHWHDLYVDILVLPGGDVVVLDEDDLEESGLAASDPVLYATIVAARDELLALIAANGYPFSEVKLTRAGD